MVYFVEMILMGILATLVMDLLAITLGKAKVIRQLVKPQAIGRWTLYMFKGIFVHEDINSTPALKNEMAVTWLSHYLIGIALAGIYLLLEFLIPAIRHQIWISLVFGIATVLLPWLWLYPSIGLGFLAGNAPRRSPYIITSLVNHTNFGLGFMIWIAFCRRFLES